jgi:PAS domain-containing protein
VTGRQLQAQTAELAATRDALEAERERYQDLFQSAPVAYLVTDPLGRVREANRAAAELLAVRPEFLPGKPLASFVAYDDRFTFRVMPTWTRSRTSTAPCSWCWTPASGCSGSTRPPAC